MQKKRLDFIGIGVQKSATTWIARCLEEHPEIHFATIPYQNNESNFLHYSKELHFFNNDSRYDKGYKWYHDKFEFGSGKSGEYSTLYFPDKNTPKRIYQYNPDVKLLLCLRNPIDRAFSQHLHEIMGGNLQQQEFNFWDAIPNHPEYIEQGKYSTHLKSYLDFFELDQIHIMFYEHIKESPEKVLFDLFNFLDIDTSFKPSILEKKINASHSYRFPRINQFIKSSSKIIRSLAGDGVAEAIKSTKILSIVEKYNNLKIDSSNPAKACLTEGDRQRLKQIFAHEIDELKSILNINIPEWN